MGDAEGLEGLLAVDKPEGPTSHDVVAGARRVLSLRRVGHSGTLDPFASGLLLLLLGRATRLAEFFVDRSKRYHGIVRLGVATDTDDRTGVPIAGSHAWRDLGPEAILDAFAAQQGDVLQRPPAFSARKVAGRRAYASARRGETPDLAPSAVRIEEIRVLRVRLPDVEFEVECSAGTYVRAIARDVGAALGVHGHLHSLRRLAIGPFDVTSSLPLSQLAPETARSRIVAPLDALGHLERLDVDAPTARALARGAAVPLRSGSPHRTSVAVAARGQLVAIAEVRQGRLHPRKVFVDG